MAGILDVISAFTTLPGPRKRFEAEQAARADELDRMTQNKIREMKASTEEELFAKRQAAQQARETMQESVFQTLKAQGLSDQEAMAQSWKTVADMETAQPLADMTTAQLTRKKNEGEMPTAGATGLLRGQAEGTGYEAERIGNIAKGNINQAAAQEGPATEVARQRAMRSSYQTQGAQADATRPGVEGVIKSGQQADTFENLNRLTSATARSKGLTPLINAEQSAQQAGFEAQKAAAGHEIATMPDPNLVNQATAADLLNKTAGSRFGAKNPIIPAMRGVDASTLMLLSNPSIAKGVFGGVTDSISSAPPPVTPSGLTNRTGTLRPRGNIR